MVAAICSDLDDITAKEDIEGIGATISYSRQECQCKVECKRWHVNDNQLLEAGQVGIEWIVKIQEHGFIARSGINKHHKSDRCTQCDENIHLSQN